MQQDPLEYREIVRSQIKDAYGRLTYSYTTQNKQADIYGAYSRRMKWLQLILSVCSTCCIMSLFAQETRIQLWLAVISSSLLALVSAFAKEASYDEKATRCEKAADSMWPIRERYIAFLADFDTMPDSEIVSCRDELTVHVAKVYATVPKTSPNAYSQAQKALKNEEEQFFTESELDNMLPTMLRSSDNS